MTAITLNFLGKILCCPPIVNSPRGKPQATRTVIIAITPNNTAPNIENINQYSPFAKHKKFQLQILIYHSLFPQKPPTKMMKDFLNFLPKFNNYLWNLLFQLLSIKIVSLKRFLFPRIANTHYFQRLYNGNNFASVIPTQLSPAACRSRHTRRG